MLPNLIVIGAAKCGTTTLHHHLGLHPEIAMSAEKELRFFVAERNWSRGRDWYETQFPAGTPVRGEASPMYTVFPFAGGVPERMAELIPDARLIYLVRDPMDRLVKEYEQAVRDGEERPLSELLTDLDHFFVIRSRYFMQLERYLSHFPAERILVLDTDELAADPAATMARAFRFAGVDDTFTSPAFGERKNLSWGIPRVRHERGEPVVRLLDRAVGPERSERLRAAAPRVLHAPFSRRVGSPKLPAAFRRALVACLAEDVARLRAHTGLPFAGWSV